MGPGQRVTTRVLGAALLHCSLELSSPTPHALIAMYRALRILSVLRTLLASTQYILIARSSLHVARQDQGPESTCGNSVDGRHAAGHWYWSKVAKRSRREITPTRGIPFAFSSRLCRIS